MPQANNSASQNSANNNNPIRRYNDGLGNTDARNEDGTLIQAECRQCGEVFAFADTFSFVCHACTNWCGSCDQSPCECESEEDEWVSIPERMYSATTLPEFQSNEAGKIITSKRVFSTEIECYQTRQAQMSDAAQALSKHIGITGDGSLGTGGVEFQTPKLKGKHGEQAIRDLCQVLNTTGFTVNKSTGLHIHLDGRGLLPKTLTTTEPIALKQLWQFYVAFDDVLLSFLPKSRRNNRYAKPMSQTSQYQYIANCNSQRDIEKLWYKETQTSSIEYNKSHKYHDSRYHGVNLHILLAEKHLEIRFHSGTTIAGKILEWTALHQRIADMAAAHTLFTSESMLGLTLEKKTKMFFSILGLPSRAQNYFLRRQKELSKDSEEDTIQVKEPQEATA